MQTTNNITKQIFMLHFPKVRNEEIRNEALINYCKNAAYYITTQSSSMKKGKKTTIHIYTKNEVRNSRVAKSSCRTELRKIM